jgi:hypothetical protein
MSLLGHKQLTLISIPEHKPWCRSDIMYHLLCTYQSQHTVLTIQGSGVFICESYLNKARLCFLCLLYLLVSTELTSSHHYVPVTYFSATCLLSFLDTCSLYQWQKLSTHSLLTRPYNCATFNMSLMFCWPCSIMYHNNVTNLIHFHNHVIVS